MALSCAAAWAAAAAALRPAGAASAAVAACICCATGMSGPSEEVYMVPAVCRGGSKQHE